MKNLKVVKVDGDVYVGEMVTGASSDRLVVALQIDSALQSTVCKSIVSAYLQLKNIGELIALDFGANASVVSRELNDDEVVLFAQAQIAFDKADKFALAKLVNRDFAGLMGK